MKNFKGKVACFCGTGDGILGNRLIYQPQDLTVNDAIPIIRNYDRTLPKPLYFNFNETREPIGTIVRVQLLGNELWAEGTLNESFFNQGYVLTPNIITSNNEIKLSSISVTTPDKNFQSIEPFVLSDQQPILITEEEVKEPQIMDQLKKEVDESARIDSQS